MTLNTKVFIHDRIDYRELFVKCNQLIGANEGTRYRDRSDCLMNEPAQGLCAWLFVYHGANRTPYRHQPDPECDRPACWAEIALDTAYGYSGPEGGCGSLHARILSELAPWLASKDVGWSWQNEWTGNIYQGTDGLETLGA